MRKMMIQQKFKMSPNDSVPAIGQDTDRNIVQLPDDKNNFLGIPMYGRDCKGNEELGAKWPSTIIKLTYT